MVNRLFVLGIFLALYACSSDDTPMARDDLATYISDKSALPLVRDSLIACALSGPIGFNESNTAEISILFYPERSASDFNYFETNDINVDPKDLNNYTRVDLPTSPVFNGYLEKFNRTAVENNKWCRVTFIRNNRLFISNAIRLKMNTIPTVLTRALSIDQTDTLSPVFDWVQSAIGENAIYFQVILNDQNDLLSGTYTFDTRFQFYDLSNVVLNIRDVNPPPALQVDQNYEFLVMGVSEDNWVNVIVNDVFTTR